MKHLFFCIVLGMASSIQSTPAQTPDIAKITSAIRVEPRYIRFGILNSVDEPGAYWADARIFETHVNFLKGDFLQAARAAILDSFEGQSIWARLETDYHRLSECVEELSLGLTPDARGTVDTTGSVEVLYSLDGPRLCLHAVPPDVATRLFVAVADDRKRYEWRLEAFSLEAEGSKVVGEGDWPIEAIEDGIRTPIMSWAVASLTGPLYPPPQSDSE